MERKGLGKGLSDLISADALKQGATLLELRPHEIEPWSGTESFSRWSCGRSATDTN